MVRLLITVYISILLCGCSIFSGVPDTPEVAQAKQFLGLFDPLKLPSVTDKKFVRFNPGTTIGYTCPAGSNTYSVANYYTEIGWIIDESKTDITLLTDKATILVYKKESGASNEDLQNRNYTITNPVPAPGQYQEVNFTQMANEFVSAGPKKYWPYERFSYYGESRLAYYTEAVLYAQWAMQIGEKDLSLKLLSLANASLSAEPDSFTQTIRYDLSLNTRAKAIEMAGAGASYQDIIKVWQVARDLCDDAESKGIIELYTKMIEEDKNWQEPDKDTFAKITSEEKAKYWIYKLRNCAAFTNVYPWKEYFDDKTPSPFYKLNELGWDALPVIIEHIDDARPTRNVYHGSLRPIFPPQLMRNSDYCQQIFEKLTDYSLYAAMPGNTNPAEWKNWVRQWWQGVKDKDGLERKWHMINEWMGNIDGYRGQYCVQGNLHSLLAALEELSKDQSQKEKILQTLKTMYGNAQITNAKAYIAEKAIILFNEHSLMDGFMREYNENPVAYFNQHYGAAHALHMVMNYGGHDELKTMAEQLKQNPNYVGAFATALGIENEIAFLKPDNPFRKVIVVGMIPWLDNKNHKVGGETDYVIYGVRLCDNAARIILRTAGKDFGYTEQTDESQRDASIERIKDWWETEGKNTYK